MSDTPPERTGIRRLVAIESAGVVLFAMTLIRWFAGAPSWLPVVVPFSGLAACALAWCSMAGRPFPLPSRETVACVGIAVLYRLPALLYPGGWVNRDGAYGAFVALHLLQGHRPAPVFTEGANYQGTLKGHVAAALGLISGSRDLPLLMVVTSLGLFLVFLVSTMALARRLAGPAGAWATGIYLALGPRFLTVFSLNCVGQYMDVLALGGLALALLARILEGSLPKTALRRAHLALGLLIGAAFWQQPVALSYVAVAVVALAWRREAWASGRVGLLLLGVVLGALPVLLWNLQNGWTSGEILGREPAELLAQAEALPFLLKRTLTVSFPILAGLSPNHPWGAIPLLRPAVITVIPSAFLAYLLLRRGDLQLLSKGRLSPGFLPPLLMLTCLGLFWTIASGRVYLRPRYLLPVMAATAVHLGVGFSWLWERSRAAASLSLSGLLALNLAGMLLRLKQGAALETYYQRIALSLEEKGIRTGYSDFSLSAPVTMFTAERIVLSSRLGPTPAYESEIQAGRVAADGPDAYVLRGSDDPEAFAAVLRDLGVSYRLDLEPVPVFYDLSRRVRIDEVAGFRGDLASAGGGDE